MRERRREGRNYRVPYNRDRLDSRGIWCHRANKSASDEARTIPNDVLEDSFYAKLRHDAANVSRWKSSRDRIEGLPTINRSPVLAGALPRGEHVGLLPIP